MKMNRNNNKQARSSKKKKYKLVRTTGMHDANRNDVSHDKGRFRNGCYATSPKEVCGPSDM